MERDRLWWHQLAFTGVGGDCSLVDRATHRVHFGSSCIFTWLQATSHFVLQTAITVLGPAAGALVPDRGLVRTRLAGYRG